MPHRSLERQVRITDNYVAFQVRVDGVPLQGQVPLALYTKPVVFVSITRARRTTTSRAHHPTKAVAFNMFTRLRRGVHVVEVLGVAGTGIESADDPPTATHLVLRLQYPRAGVAVASVWFMRDSGGGGTPVAFSV